MGTEQGHPLGVTDTPEPRPARQAINEMLDAGLLDELMDRVDAGELTLTGEGGFLPEMVKAVLERGLQAELTGHLGYEKGDRAGRGSPNSRNGTTPKTLATEVGNIGLDVPRDRASTFEPRLVPKGARRAGGLDEMIVSLYAGGMTVRDIQHHLARTLGTELSHDTISTYWETETADELADLADDPTDDETTSPAEAGTRAFGHSKDHRGDLPQVVIAMAVTRDGVPVRCWTFPGDTADTAIIRTIKDDLGGWGLRRLVWVADRGFASAANRAYLTRGGGHYIHAEKLRQTNTEAAAALARPGRYRTVADNLRVKEVAVAPGGDGDGDGGARTQRFVICHNPEQADRDQRVRANLVAHLPQLIDGSDSWTARRRDELVGSLKAKPGLRRYLRRTTRRAAAGRPRRDQAGVPPGRQVAAAHLRPHPHPRRPGRRLQAAARRRTRLARLQRRPRAAPGLPLPRGPHPRPHPAVLARATAAAGDRDRHRRHLAQHPPRTRPDAPGHPGHQRRADRPTHHEHPRPADPAPRARPARTAPDLRLHPPRAAAEPPAPRPTRVVTRPRPASSAFPQVNHRIRTLVCS